MPKVSGPQHIIKVTEDILSAQYCQYIYSALAENRLHERLEQGFTGFINDISYEPIEQLTTLDLVHTEIVCLLDLLFSLQRTTTKEVFLDCVHYFKLLESVLPNMSLKIFHIAYHLNQYLSEERKVLDAEDIMSTFEKHGYPQQPIDIDHLETCSGCYCASKLDQAICILLKLANDIPAPSFSWILQRDNCKLFLQEVKRLYTFRRTFESSHSFMEHNYSFLQANSNQSPVKSQDDILGSVEAQSRGRRSTRSKSAPEDPKVHLMNQMSSGRCSSLPDNLDEDDLDYFYKRRRSSSPVCESNDPHWLSDMMNCQTQTDFENGCSDHFFDDRLCPSPDDNAKLSAVETWCKDVESTCYSPVKSSERLELSFFSDLDDNEMVVEQECDVENSQGTDSDVTVRYVPVSTAQCSSLQRGAENVQETDLNSSNSCGSALNIKKPNAVSSPTKGKPPKKPPKRMLVVYVERLDLRKWFKQKDDQQSSPEESENDETDSDQENEPEDERTVSPMQTDSTNDKITNVECDSSSSTRDTGLQNICESPKVIRRLFDVPESENNVASAAPGLRQRRCSESQSDRRSSTKELSRKLRRYSDSDSRCLHAYQHLKTNVCEVISPAELKTIGTSDEVLCSSDEPPERTIEVCDISPDSSEDKNSPEKSTTLLQSPQSHKSRSSSTKETSKDSVVSYMTRSRRKSYESPSRTLRSSKLSSCSTDKATRSVSSSEIPMTNVCDDCTVLDDKRKPGQTKSTRAKRGVLRKCVICGCGFMSDVGNHRRRGLSEAKDHSPNKDSKQINEHGIKRHSSHECRLLCDKGELPNVALQFSSESKRQAELHVLPQSPNSSQDEGCIIVPAKRCCQLLRHHAEDSSLSTSSRLSSSSSCSSSTEQSTRIRHKLYTGAADKIMAISRRRLNEDCLLDSEIKAGPKAYRSVKDKPHTQRTTSRE